MVTSMEMYEKINRVELDVDKNTATVTLWISPNDEWGLFRSQVDAWRVELEMVFGFDPQHPIRTIRERAVVGAKDWTKTGNLPSEFQGSRKLQGGWPRRRH